MLTLIMASESSDKKKPEDEARAREKESEPNDAVQPAREKIPEGEGNLRRRADWFQKRTGQTP
jgi:hypothetical protein